jgi:hypothetical protein
MVTWGKDETALFPRRLCIAEGETGAVILKIVYWTVATVYLLMLVAFAFAIEAHTLGDILWVGLAALYLAASSVLFLRSTSVPRRCAAIAMLVLAPVALLTWSVLHLPIL